MNTRQRIDLGVALLGLGVVLLLFGGLTWLSLTLLILGFVLIYR